MDKNIKKKLEEYKKLLSADCFKKGKQWRGYNVYEPIYKREVEGGLPRVVLEKNGIMRESSHQECFEYMTFVGRKAV